MTTPKKPEAPKAPTKSKELGLVVTVKNVKNGWEGKVSREHYLRYQDQLELV